MIRIDFGDSQGDTTVWMLVDDMASLHTLQDCMARLATGDDSLVRLVQELFRFDGVIKELGFEIVNGNKDEASIYTVADGIGMRVRRTTSGWSEASSIVKSLNAGRHQYIDISDVTVYVSALEGLRRRDRSL